MPRAMLRTFRAGEFDPARLVREKAGQKISVCLPARDEEDTVGEIVEILRKALVEQVPLIEEILVVDDHSSDRTAEVAAEAGAVVLAADEILAEYGEGHGKGEALWKSLYASRGDLIVWCDADVRQFDPAFVVGLVGPLLARPDLVFVKGFYERPLEHGSGQGGRVTELLARPVVALLFPHLAPIVQPLAGEYAGRREALEQLSFVEGYGVDLGLLIDVAARFGLEAMAQVDLGVRVHRNRPLDELSPQATAVLQTALRRADPDLIGPSAVLARPGLNPMIIESTERPPLIEVPGYRRTSA
ncbi:MAG TPA: glucosyl-3-phosphoglycerate synthase [Acidimicrobiales bacterium]